MTEPELLHPSERELELYGELVATYRDLQAMLTDEHAAVDPAGLAAGHKRAEAATAELRAIAAALGPWRLAAEAVPAAVTRLWRASASLAAEAAAANAELANRARARQARLSSRLAELGHGRRGLAGYRPAGGPRALAIEQRA